MRHLLLLLALVGPPAALAGEAEPAPAEPTPTQAELEDVAEPEAVELDVDAVAAVQVRDYRLKHELSLGLGYLPFDAFGFGLSAQVAYAYHFSDHFAWQVGRGLFNYGLTTNLRKTLEARYGATPTEFDRVEWAVGSDLVLSPLYGKAALFNSTVLWFEVYVEAGASAFKLASGFTPAANAGVGVRLFTGKHLSARLEGVNHFLFPRKRLNIFAVQASVAMNFGAAE